MQFDWNKLKVFYYVYQTKSPTKTAKILHLTQSGISQHIKNLEEELDISLFTRHHKTLIPTHVAHELYQSTFHFFQKLENFTKILKDTNAEVEGKIFIGTPSGFSIKILSHLLTSFSKKYPKISFYVDIGEPSQIEPRLIDGSLDFAFTDDYKCDSKIKLTPVFTEEIVAAGNVDLIKKLGKSKDMFNALTEENFVVYRRDAPIVNSWFSYHFGKTPDKINIHTKVLDIPTIIEIIKESETLAILPLYHLHDLVKEKKLNYFKMKRKMTNTIHIAHRKDHHEPKIITLCRKFFIQALKDLDPCSAK